MSVLRNARQQRAARVINIHESEALSGHLILGLFILKSVRNKDTRTDGLDPKRSPAGGDLRVDEGIGSGDKSEVAVEHVDTSVVEVSRIETIAGRCLRVREPLVDRALSRPIGQDDGLIALRRMPATNLPRLRIEHEKGSACR